MKRPSDAKLFSRRRRSRLWIALLCILIATGVGAWVMRDRWIPAVPDLTATARAEKRSFVRLVHRTGVIAPLREERIFTKLAGTILEVAAEGSVAQKDEIVMKLDPRLHEDALALALE